MKLNSLLGNTIRIAAKSGTDISFILSDGMTIPFTTHEPGANAYLPPAEISYDIASESANGVIVVDVTIGELRVNTDLIHSFGIVDEPVSLNIENGNIVEFFGGKMAERLKFEFSKLPVNSRKIVEFGVGLSQMKPSGIIGIDEGIIGTCHFGFGSGNNNDAPIHFDVVVNDFIVECYNV